MSAPLATATDPARPTRVEQVGIDPDADSLDAVREHARRRLKRLRALQSEQVAQLVETQRQIARERTVLMLNGVDPDVGEAA